MVSGITTTIVGADLALPTSRTVMMIYQNRNLWKNGQSPVLPVMSKKS